MEENQEENDNPNEENPVLVDEAAAVQENDHHGYHMHGRFIRSLREYLRRSVSEVSDPFEVDPVEPMSSSEDNDNEDIEVENRLFEEYLQQNDRPVEPFNIELPTEHSYLGQMDSVSGLDIFEPLKVYRIQIFEHHSFVFPGETLPMIWSDSQFEGSGSANEGLTFGLVFWDPTFKKKVGVTCQVFEKGVDMHGNITLKCRAHQRFTVVKQQKGSSIQTGAPYSRRRCFADVKIQPEVELQNPLHMIMANSLKPMCCSSKNNKIVLNHSAATTRWPKFVYDQVDISRVLQKVERFLSMLKIESAPTDLSKLSFWLARNVPISEQTRYEIFITNSVTERLLILGKALDVTCYFYCKRCKNKLSSYNEIFAMSREGVQSSYCNPSGYIHETLTVYNMVEQSSYLVDRPSTDFSWFPGYAWQILLCNNCQVHIGWKFIATKKNLVPRTFYGLSGKSITVDKDIYEIDVESMFPSPVHQPDTPDFPF